MTDEQSPQENHGQTRSWVIVGDGERAVVGDRCLARAGAGGVAIAGDQARAEAGPGGHAVAGVLSCALSGSNGRSVTGERGYSVSDDGGTAITGEWGVAMAGVGGKVAGGAAAFLAIAALEPSGRSVLLAATVGEGGIRPGVLYEALDGGFAEAADQSTMHGDA